MKQDDPVKQVRPVGEMDRESVTEAVFELSSGLCEWRTGPVDIPLMVAKTAVSL